MLIFGGMPGLRKKNPHSLINKIKERGFMKKGSYSQIDFVNLVKQANPDIEVIGQFAGVEKKIAIACSHNGHSDVYAYRLLKPNKHCCKLGYYESKKGKSLQERIDMYKEIVPDFISFDECFLQEHQKLHNLYCSIHNMYFSQWFNSLRLGLACPSCGKEKRRISGATNIALAGRAQFEKGLARFVSRAETEWLNELNVPVRQYWLPDVKYSVDGFDPSTNTVFLYHGAFWHGCPNKFDPEEVHPILKVKMKELYKKTMLWENKIKEAGYNLVTEWGK
jgi:hypothetical protein